MELLDEVKKIEALENVPEEQLQWLVSQCDSFEFKAGDYLFKPGDHMDKMFLILKGNFVLKSHQNNQFRVVGNFEPRSITGLLPYSRAKEARGYAEATGDSFILALHKDHFHKMVTDFEELTTTLVHLMSSRIREFTKLEQQNDKMMALGKLSAGLAHELNNPSAAVVRSSQTLKTHLSSLPERFKRVMEIDMNEAQIDIVNDLLFSKLGNSTGALPMMEKSEKEDSFMDWLEDRDIEDADEVAENMVDFGFEEEDLDAIDEQVQEKDLSAIIHWVNQVLTTEKLVSEIEDASKRINDLVMSVKSYTHMDQSQEKKFSNVHEGIDNTLVMLGHKLRKENIEIVKNYDKGLQPAEVLPSALNQVWTNLIDNAIDAMKNMDQRTLTVETLMDGDFINVNISDSGTGIPDEIKDKIFDPFFTTKGVGEGTGIGLEVVHRIVTKDHRGSIKVQSQNSGTTFKVCIPVKATL